MDYSTERLLTYPRAAAAEKLMGSDFYTLLGKLNVRLGATKSLCNTNWAHICRKMDMYARWRSLIG